MKKTLLILIAIFCINIANASNIDSTIKSVADTSLTFKTVYGDIKSGITALAASLKIGADHVYGVLVKQQVANSITDLLLILILFILTIIAYRLAKKTFASHMALKPTEDSYRSLDWSLDDSAKGVASVAIGIGTGILFIITITVFCDNFQSIITGFVNPEYGAIKEILSFVK